MATSGLTGENDPDCRKSMNWENPNKDLLMFYKTIIAIRKIYRCCTGIQMYFCRIPYTHTRHLDKTAYIVLNKKSVNPFNTT